MLCLGHGQVAAQSSYTVSTLKPTATGAAMMPNCINERDEVFGNADYFKRTVFSFSPPGFVKLYDEYPAKWAVTSAATVSPTKADTKGGEAQYGPRCGRLHNGVRLVDPVTAKVITLPAAVSVGPPNDAGTQVLIWALGASASYWTPASGVQTLAAPGYQSPYASALNNAGDVLGTVQVGTTNVYKAAMWVGGTQFQVLAPGFGDSSSGVAINDARQVLVSTDVLVQEGTDTLRVAKLAVWDQGVIKPLLPPGDGRYAKRGLINNKGTVTATVGREPLPNVYAPPDMRAVIWQNGVLSDLTDHVNARGANLPAGAVVEGVLAMNDKGSMLVFLRSTTPQHTLLRLIAKP
jgi:hypothetical protein